MKPISGDYFLSDIKNAYAAGIIDGEGCISIYCEKKSKKYKGEVQVTSTTLQLMEWLHKELGGIYHTTKKTEGHKQKYRWYICGHRGATLLQRVYPYLVVKRKHAEVYYKFYQSMGNHMHGCYGVDEAVLAERDVLLKEMRKLNKRGDK